ncbi:MULTISPECIES: hypothetical protein [unclassified Moorena]|uniref:hypothetical protein n=1 Tax=unclassified Moorena TaxID=2683338 RepID=UPI0013C94488|nr:MULTISPECIES: hypothetical protein [unclassified Moorena]NEO17883.1 hypothetical protein [Moorena sp. SIO4A5]NEQ59869.1 hypothetical protein [Moorena sp. SIO4A1]
MRLTCMSRYAMLLWSRYANAFSNSYSDRISISYAIDLWSRYAMKRSFRAYAIAFPIPNFPTIPILTQSLILETTALDLLSTLSTLTTL